MTVFDCPSISVAGMGVLVSWTAFVSKDLTGISGDGIAAEVGSSFCKSGACCSDRLVSIGSSFTGPGVGSRDSACGGAGLDEVTVGSVTRLVGL